MSDELDLDQVARVTYSAVFSDVLDHLGLREQTLAPAVRRFQRPVAYQDVPGGAAA